MVTVKHVGLNAQGARGMVRDGLIVNVRLSDIGGDTKVPARMMIDTGADTTCVIESIPAQLQLVPMNYQTITGVNNTTQQPTYYMQMEMEMGSAGTHGVMTFQAEMVGIPASKSSIQGLIGRDFLKDFTLVYDGKNGMFELQYMIANQPKPSTPSQPTKKDPGKKKRNKAQARSRRANRGK